jgi:hypothetical protein
MAEFQQHLGPWDTTTCEARLRDYRRLASETRLLEAYSAEWHLDLEILRIRVYRYPDRSEVTGEVSEVSEPAQIEAQRRSLIGTEWQSVVMLFDAIDFWKLPTRHEPSSAMFHSECWTIEGYRDDQLHFVRRNSCSVLEGVGAEVFRLGRSMASFAGIRRFEDTEN